jgi:hypothetical protein
MKRLIVAAACVLLAGCDKKEPVSGAAPAAPKGMLPVQKLPAFSSYEDWCQHIGKGTCTGQWEGHAPGTSNLGPYRFVVVEYTELRDGEGTARDVFFELKTARGFSYFAIGRTRPGKVSTSVMVSDVVDRPGALELRTVFRTSPRFTFSDYHSACFIVNGPNSLGVAEIALGKVIGNTEGESKGTPGEATWHDGKVTVKGASIADGEWTIALP